MQASHKLAEQMYAQSADQGAPEGAPGGEQAQADDNVVDAEFEEVKDDDENKA